MVYCPGCAGARRIDCLPVSRIQAARHYHPPPGEETNAMTTWILVSDTSRGKLFSTELREDDWSLVKEFEHPEGREASKDIRPSSPPGRMLQTKAHGARHTAMEPQTTPKEAEAERFAQHLSEYLEHAIAERQFDYLVLVAPPRFLGTLHGSLGRQAAKHLRAAINKDYCTLAAAELRERLVDEVFPLEHD
jgi:protein required for attachment to host cells